MLVKPITKSTIHILLVIDYYSWPVLWLYLFHGIWIKKLSIDLYVLSHAGWIINLDGINITRALSNGLISSRPYLSRWNISTNHYWLWVIGIWVIDYESSCLSLASSKCVLSVSELFLAKLKIQLFSSRYLINLIKNLFLFSTKTQPVLGSIIRVNIHTPIPQIGSFLRCRVSILGTSQPEYPLPSLPTSPLDTSHQFYYRRDYL